MHINEKEGIFDYVNNKQVRHTMENKIKVAIDNVGGSFFVADLRFCKANVRCHFRKWFKTEKGATRWAERKGYEVV